MSAQFFLLNRTHTHSGPGGFTAHPLYDTTTLGYHKDNAKTIVNGMVESIKMAHDNMSRGGRILLNQGKLLNANINRGLFAYEQNPLQERASYEHNGEAFVVCTV